MKRSSKLSKISLNKETLTTLSSRQLTGVAGGCTDNTSGDGLICPRILFPTSKIPYYY